MLELERVGCRPLRGPAPPTARIFKISEAQDFIEFGLARVSPGLIVKTEVEFCFQVVKSKMVSCPDLNNVLPSNL